MSPRTTTFFNRGPKTLLAGGNTGKYLGSVIRVRLGALARIHETSRKYPATLRGNGTGAANSSQVPRKWAGAARAHPTGSGSLKQEISRMNFETPPPTTERLAYPCDGPRGPSCLTAVVRPNPSKTPHNAQGLCEKPRHWGFGRASLRSPRTL